VRCFFEDAGDGEIALDTNHAARGVR
jgi:hypothetical protein